MKEYTGWLFDLYLQTITGFSNPKHGITVWLLGEDGKSHSFTQEFSITFYVTGPFHRLHQLWKYLQEKQVVLSRTERDDLYSGKKDVLEVRVPNPIAFDELFKEIHQRFPDLSYYDVDIPLILRYAAAFDVFPLAYCKVEVEQGWNISSITPLDTPWELDLKLPNLRILYLRPDVNPAMLNPNIYRWNSNSSSIICPSRNRARFWAF